MGGAEPSAAREVGEFDDCVVVGLGPLLGELGLQPFACLGRSEPAALIPVYASTARLVFAAATPEGEPFVVLSKLSDGRILVTTREFVPPHERVVLNQNRRQSLGGLIESHVEMLDILRRMGLHVVESSSDVVVDQLRFEWEAWDHLGPFFGPLLAVGRRPKPFVLQARVSEEALWTRTSAQRRRLVGVDRVPSDREPVDEEPTLRLVSAA